MAAPSGAARLRELVIANATKQWVEPAPGVPMNEYIDAIRGPRVKSASKKDNHLLIPDLLDDIKDEFETLFPKQVYEFAYSLEPFSYNLGYARRAGEFCDGMFVLSQNDRIDHEFLVMYKFSFGTNEWSCGSLDIEAINGWDDEQQKFFEWTAIAFARATNKDFDCSGIDMEEFIAECKYAGRTIKSASKTE